MTARWLVLAAALGGLGVTLGAFGAHGLERLQVAEGDLEIWETAVRYQMYHALALFGIAWLDARGADRSSRLAGWCFALGVLIFSGSLFVLVLTGARWLGAVTPLGGVLLVVGWALTGRAALSLPRET